MNAADLLHGPPRPAVVRANQEDHALDEPERMLKHEPLHLAVVATAPVGPGQERPADLDFAALGVVTVEPRRPDDSAIPRVCGEQRAAGRQGVAEEGPEDL